MEAETRAICNHCSIVLPLQPGAPCPRCGVGHLAHPVVINGTPTTVAGLVVLVPPEAELELCGCEESRALTKELGRLRQLMAEVLEDRAATAARLEWLTNSGFLDDPAGMTDQLVELADNERAEIERARRSVCCPAGGGS